LKGACVAKPGTKASSLFKYVDFPGQVCELTNIFLHNSHLLFFQALKREGFQIGGEEIEEQGSDRQEDRCIDKEEDKWVDEEEDRQEEEQEEKQVQYHNTTAHSNLWLPFFPLCRLAGLVMRGKS
jgi:hypothetical protein